MASSSRATARRAPRYSRSASIRRNSPSMRPRRSTHPDVSRLRRSLNGEKLAIGVDRLDYSKGLVNRIKAFDRMWTLHPQLKRAASLLQIATPSRGAIEAYGNLQSEVAKLVSDVNGTSWRGRLDADPLSQQGLRPGGARGSLSHRAGRRGDAVAGRHESGRQGICRGPKPRRSRRAGAVEIRRRRQRTRHRAVGQSRTTSTAWRAPSRPRSRCR